MPAPSRPEDLAAQLERLVGRVAELEGLCRALGDELASARPALEAAARAGVALRESEARLRALLDGLSDLIFVFDREGRYLDFHAAQPEKLYVPPEQFVGRPVEEVLPAAVARQFRDGFARLAATGEVQTFDYDLEIGGRVLSFEARLAPCGTDRVLVVVRDVTRRRRAEQEQRRAEEQLREARRLESLGVLAGGVAHDFNNLLTGILGFAELTRLELPPDSRLHGYLGEIERASLRAADLCRQMLAYAGKGRLLLAPLDLSALVRDAEPLLHAALAGRAELAFELAPGLPPVRADADQLRQALVNLVVNAAEALGERGGVVTVATGRARADRTYLAAAPHGAELAEGDYVYAEVRDAGAGMSPEVLARAFEPFFTTKFTGRGLGLAAVLGIARAHGGAVKAESAAGAGTTVRLLLPPAAGAGAGAAPAAGPAPAERFGRGTALVVDDDDAVRHLAARSLEDLGFRTVTAADGAAALEAVRQHADVRLVLLDLTMPRMDGEEALRRLRELRPELPVVVMSGYSEGELNRRFSGLGVAAFLPKPFQRADLAERVRAALAWRPE